MSDWERVKPMGAAPEKLVTLAIIVIEIVAWRVLVRVVVPDSVISGV